jgi:hypothetical protein
VLLSQFYAFELERGIYWFLWTGSTLFTVPNRLFLPTGYAYSGARVEILVRGWADASTLRATIGTGYALLWSLVPVIWWFAIHTSLIDFVRIWRTVALEHHDIEEVPLWTANALSLWDIKVRVHRTALTFPWCLIPILRGITIQAGIIGI